MVGARRTGIYISGIKLTIHQRGNWTEDYVAGAAMAKPFF